MDKLQALNAFVAVAEAGGFSKAARRLGVATSSLTRLIDALEQQLGTALLTRSTRAVMLTDSGAAYLAQIEPLLNDMQQADESIADQGSEAVGPLRVTAPVSFGRLFIGPRIAGFLARHPRVSLDLDLSDAQIDLAAERVDIAVRIGVPASQEGLIVRPLAEHRRLVVASASYLAASGTPLTPDQLAEHTCMRFAYRQGPQRWTFAQAGNKRRAVQVDIGGRFSANNADVLREAALAGHGIALLAEWLVGEDVRQGRLLRLLKDWTVNPMQEDVSIYAAYLPNRRRSRKVQAFLDFLGECCAAPAGKA